MKKLLFSAVSALALAGVATAADSTQFGAMQVLSSDARTLVAVPWNNSAAGDNDVVVSNFVLTANLTQGDTLDTLKSDGTRLNRWRLDKNGSDVLYWQSVTQVSEGGEWTPSDPPDQATIARGSSVILIRQSYVSGGNPIPFYVMGQVASTGSSTKITAGTTEAPIYNMLAPPSTVAQSLNGGEHGATWDQSKGTIVDGDRIYVPNGTQPSIELVYTQEGKSTETRSGTKYWCSMTALTKTIGEMTIKTGIQYDKYTGEIPLGTGIWYLSRGGSPTVTWQDIPTAN